MIEYWYNWNFIWFILYKFNLLNMTPALKLSIINSSLIGFYIAHNKNDFFFYITLFIPYPTQVRFKIPRIYHCIGDIIIHQLPMYYLLSVNKKDIDTSNCALNIIYPLSYWYFINYSRGINFDKIYNLDINKILLSGILIISGLGIRKHLLR